MRGSNEALRLGHRYVGTEHVLAVLVRRSRMRSTAPLDARSPTSTYCSACSVLRGVGVSLRAAQAVGELQRS